MFASSTLFLSTFFLFWSTFIRHFAFYLIKDCVDQPIKISIFSSIDILTTMWWLFAAYKISNYYFVYFIFFSALWITVHTDLKYMLISRFVSLYLIPFGIFFAYLDWLPLNPLHSSLAACFGYIFFWTANKIFYALKGHDGLGQGDLELIAYIGAFTGFLGSWFSILFGSIVGTILGCCYMVITRKVPNILPFGPFLALAASTFVLNQAEIMIWLLS